MGVEVTANGADYTNSGLSHTYIKQPVCLHSRRAPMPPGPIIVAADGAGSGGLLAGGVASWEMLRGVNEVRRMP